MKKLIILIVICSMYFSCESLSQKDAPEKEYLKGGISYKTEGWVDNNTFRVVSIGFPKQNVTNKMKRQYYAKEAAILSAQKTILEKFKGARVQGKASSTGGEIDEVIIQKEFGGIINGGSVTEEKYDEQDNCQVTYEVSSLDLKKRVMFGVQ